MEHSGIFQRAFVGMLIMRTMSVKFGKCVCVYDLWCSPCLDRAEAGQIGAVSWPRVFHVSPKYPSWGKRTYHKKLLFKRFFCACMLVFKSLLVLQFE